MASPEVRAKHIVAHRGWEQVGGGSNRAEVWGALLALPSCCCKVCFMPKCLLGGTHGCKASSQFDPAPASLPGSVTQHGKWLQNPGGAEGRQLTPTCPHTHSVPSVKPPCTSAGPEQRAPLLGRTSAGSRPCPSCPAGSGHSPLPLAGPTEPSSLQSPEKESRLELGTSASLSVPPNFKMKPKSGGSCPAGVQTTFSLGPLTQLENFMRFWGSELCCQRLRVAALWGTGGGDKGSHSPVSSGANTHYLLPGAHCGKAASPTPSSSLELALCCPFTRGPVLLPRASTVREPIWKVATLRVCTAPFRGCLGGLDLRAAG